MLSLRVNRRTDDGPRHQGDASPGRARIILTATLSALLLAGVAGCPGAGVLGILPFGSITAVQLFDQPAFTVAFSVDTAVNSPALVARVNWVFGDGTGFVEGAAGRTSITYRYAAPGTYQVSAFIFSSSGFLSQVNGTVTVVGDGGGGGGPTDAPAAAAGFQPANNATNVAVTTKLRWTAGARATSHDVYLGLVEDSVTNAGTDDPVNFMGNVTTTEFEPEEELLPNTTYYWRIDEVNAGGTTRGTVQKFKTAEATGKAKTPIPANGSVTARFDQVLSWTAGRGATNRDVYFGKDLAAVTDATPETEDIFQGNQTSTTFDPGDEDAVNEGELLPATTYFWRIDEKGPGGTAKGDVWSFTTRAAPPPISDPSPSDLETDVNINENLAWNAPASVESFDIYLGLDPVDVELADRTSPEFKGNQTNRLFDPGTLLPATVYYWRVDTRGPGGTSPGQLFSFTTADVPPVVVGPFTPSNNAQNVSITQDLGWNAGAGGIAETFEVYFSSTEADVINGVPSARRAILDVSVTMLDLVTDLDPSTQYFWRVDTLGPGGRRIGPVLRFRTGSLPGPATNPDPANGAREISTIVMLMWTAGVGSTSSDVFFGTSESAVTNATLSDAEFRTNTAGTSFDPGQLNVNTDYFWRIDARSAGGPRKGSTWRFRTGPGKAVNPVPLNGTTNIPTSQDLAWTAGAGAVSHNVYLGTVQTEVEDATPSTTSVFRGNQTATTFDPGNLTANTQFFWRIDEVAENGDTTKGDVWNFTTLLGKATNPNPFNQQENVALDVILEWTAGEGAELHRVFFGTSLTAVTNAVDGSPEDRGDQTATTFDPGSVPIVLTPNTTYFWRIDTLAGATVTTGDVWRFKTVAPPPQASGPSPINGATNVSLTPVLTWTRVNEATSYDVYFGTSQAAVAAANTGSPEFQGNQTTESFSPTGLTNNTTYFWRIDTKNAAGTTMGVVWSFTTVP